MTYEQLLICNSASSSSSVPLEIVHKAQIGCTPSGKLHPSLSRFMRFVKLTSTNSIILFACCQGLLLYCAGWTVYQTVPHTEAGWLNVDALFQNKTFLDLAMSLLVSATLIRQSATYLPVMVTPIESQRPALLPTPRFSMATAMSTIQLVWTLTRPLGDLRPLPHLLNPLL